MGKIGKGTGSFGKRKTKTHMMCKRCGRHSFHKQKHRCASCSFPKATRRYYNWSFKARRRRAGGTGRMRYLKVILKRKPRFPDEVPNAKKFLMETVEKWHEEEEKEKEKS